MLEPRFLVHKAGLVDDESPLGSRHGTSFAYPAGDSHDACVLLYQAHVSGSKCFDRRGLSRELERPFSS